jgi:hypothetical protein
MIRLINAKIIARRTTKALLKKEIPIINKLIEDASEAGKFCVPIGDNECSYATELLLKKAGYRVDNGFISWAHIAIATHKNENELMKVAKEAGVSILKVQ